jgi:uncharacterized protein (DUF885 family)
VLVYRLHGDVNGPFQEDAVNLRRAGVRSDEDRSASDASSPVRGSALAAIVLTIAVAAGGAAWSAPAADEASARARREVADAAESWWQRQLETDLGLRLRQGLRMERLGRVTEESVRRECEFARGIVARLRAVPAEQLAHEDWLTMRILAWEANAAVEEGEHYWQGFTVTPYAMRGILKSPFPSLKIVHDGFRARTFAGAADLAGYLALLREYPRLVGEHQTRLEGQARRGIRIPADQIDQTVPILRPFAQPAESSLFAVAEDRLGRIEPARRAAFRREVAKVVEESVNPAILRLAAALDGDYRARAPKGVGLGQYPGGDAYYRHLVRLHTTLDLTPEQIHETGLAEVEAIAARMAAVRERIGFRGTVAEYHRGLASDPRFLAKTPDEVGARLMSFVEVLRPRLSEFFGRMPRAPYGVKRLDPALEGSMTYGYYQKPSASETSGFYYYNGSDLGQRSQIDAAALIAHELVPGHHFQMALQRETESLPAFRRETLPTAFIEGWGLYSSLLAADMGLYNDPHDEYGLLVMDSFLTTRLVVDTGMNALGWSRERAGQFMKENTLQSDEQVRTETLRYAADIPGQALAYRTGARKLVELREKARRALGPRFDVRRFHDAVIGSGAMPLSVLEEHVDWFIREEQRATPAR